MRYLLIRLLMIVGMLGVAGSALAIKVSITGHLSSELPYYVYRIGPLELTGDIGDLQSSDRQNWKWGSWFIFSKDKYDGAPAGIDPADCGKKFNIWGHYSIPGAARMSNISTLSKDNPITIWATNQGNERNPVINGIFPCSAAMTWLDLRDDASWFNSPSYMLTIGPDKSAIQGSTSFDRSSSSNVPADLSWEQGHEYILRLFARITPTEINTTYEAVAERTLIYMGDVFSVDQTENAEDQSVKHPGSYVITISPNSPRINNKFFFTLDCETSLTNITLGTHTTYKNSTVNTDGGIYKATINLRSIEAPGNYFRKGDEVEAYTLCNSTVNQFSKLSQLITQHDDYTDTKSEVFTHHFKIVSDALLAELSGRYLPDGSVRVAGKFDDLSPEQPKILYAVKNSMSQEPNWLTPDNVRWNPGETNPANCPECFSFTIPASNLSKDKINLVQVLPALHTEEQAADPNVVTFEPQDFIDARFISASGVALPCGEGYEVTPVRDNTGNTLIKLQLTIKHAVDKITGEIDLPSIPITYKGNGTISYSGQGQPESETKYIQIDENDKGKQAIHWAVNTADKILNAGTYVISLPVNIPSYRSDDFGAQSLILNANVYTMRSILLKPRDSLPAPEQIAVRCMTMFHGSMP